MSYCSACGERLPENAAFCPQCGSQVVRPSGAEAGYQAPPSSGASAAGENKAPAGDFDFARGEAKSAGAGEPVSIPPALGIPENVAGMLCYIFPAAIIFLLIQPYNRNRFIRFHAFQSILLMLAWIVLHAVVAVPWFGWLLWPAMELAFVIAWVVLLIKSYKGVMFKLPAIGDIAEQQAAK
jgi:uncharacterized membrane protein